MSKKKKKDRGGKEAKKKKAEKTNAEKNVDVLNGVTVKADDAKEKPKAKAKEKPKAKAKEKPKEEPKEKPKEEPKEKPPEKKTNARKELKPVSKGIQKKMEGCSDKKGKACNLRIAAEDVTELRMYLGHRGKGDKVQHRLTLSPIAERQFLKRFDIPAGFLQRLDPAVRADVANWFLSTVPKEDRWTLKVKGNFIRAFIMGDKVTFNHLETLEQIAENLPEGLLLDWWKAIQGSMHVRLVFPEMPLTLDDKANKDLFAGLHIMANEFGEFSTKVDFIIWRETGSTAIIPLVEKKRFYRAGFPKDANALAAELGKGLSGVLARMNPAMEELKAKITKATKKKTSAKSVALWIEKLRKKYRFASKVGEKTVERFENEEGNGWGAILAFAYIAGQTKDPMARYDLECMAGLFLDAV